MGKGWERVRGERATVGKGNKIGREDSVKGGDRKGRKWVRGLGEGRDGSVERESREGREKRKGD